MEALVNVTPFLAMAPPLRDPTGARVATAIVKATFVVGRGRAPRLADEQAPIRPADVPRDPEALTSSLLYPSDFVPSKVGADVIVVGEAISAKAKPVHDVAVRVRDRTVSLAAHGPRVFFSSLGQVKVGPASATERVPIVYEKAYGGMTADFQIVERRNPAGVGVARRPADLDGKPAPQIEDPAAPITRAGEAFAPAGLGAIPPHWAPRADRAGTFDERWREERMPLLPEGFDPAFYNAAHPALHLPVPLRPGDEVAILGMHPEGMFRFQIPRFLVRVCARRHEGPQEIQDLLPDTLIVEPGADRFELVARASFRVGRGPASLAGLRVDLHDAD